MKTNYDTLKEYEENKEPLPQYNVWKNIHEQWKIAIQQIERLQEQLKEANELISLLFPISINKERVLEKTTEYMEKWSLK